MATVRQVGRHVLRPGHVTTPLALLLCRSGICAAAAALVMIGKYEGSR